MNEAFNELSLPNSSRRRTYKKLSVTVTEEAEPFIPSVLGTGFLFENETVKKVKNRLEGIEKTVNIQELPNQISQTQIISNLYDDGEELEIENEKMSKDNTKTFSSETQRIEFNATATVEQVVESENRCPQDDNLSQTKADVLTVLDDNKEIENDITVLHEDTQLIPNTISTYVDSNNDTFTGHVIGKMHQKLKMHSIISELQRNKTNYDKKHKQRNFNEGKNYDTNKVRVSKEQFLEDFDESSSNEDESAILIKIKHKAISNPMINNENRSCIEPNMQNKCGPLKNYEHLLQRESKSKECIALSSEEDTDDEQESAVLKSHQSKASLLDLRARLSRQKALTVKTENSTCLKKLYNGLKEASKKQIIEYEKQVMEKKGICAEDIEKEKRIVEDLLEQEIARNKRIRMKEKVEEKEQKLPKDSFDEIENYSGDESDNELNEEVDENYDNSDISSESSNIEEVKVEKYMDCETSDEKIEDDDEAAGDFIISRTKGKHRIVIDEDSDSDFEHDTKENSNSTTIYLGEYGENLKENNLKDTNEVDTSLDDNSSTETDEEERRRVIADINARRLRKEMKNRMKRKEMKKKGLNNILEMEAEESEDEWHGIGGADGELSDEYDSEIEKMIDDYSTADTNPEEIRNMLTKEHKELDLKMVNKILHDIKNGGFRKRRGAGMVLEISDEEDEFLEKYRSKRKEIMRQKRLQFANSDKKLINNDKSLPFFESIMDDIADNKMSAEIEDNDLDRSFENHDTQEDNENTKKRKIELSEEFVHQSLSFLKDCKNEDKPPHFESANPSKDEQVPDLFSLKKESFIKTLHAPIFAGANDILEDAGQQWESAHKFKSVCAKFGSNIGVDEKLKTGRKTVTVSRMYKSVGGNRASVTYLGKMRKLVAPQKKIGNRLSGGLTIPKARVNSLFADNEKSFEN